MFHNKKINLDILFLKFILVYIFILYLPRFNVFFAICTHFNIFSCNFETQKKTIY